MPMALIVAFGVYFAILGIIGFFAYQHSKQTGDFVLGSRSLSYWVTALAAHASDMSGWLFMAFPAAVYAHGLIEAWTAVGLVFFMYLNWKFVAPKLRSITEKYKTSTLSSFFEKHFNDSTGSIRIVSALFCLLFFTFYISANFVVLGHLFESIFNLSYVTGIAIGSLVIFYVLLGGFVSIAWVDFFQGMFLLCMIVLVPLVAFFSTSSVQAIEVAAAAKKVSLNLFPHTFAYFLETLLLAFGWGLGYFGQPHIITKFMGIKRIDEMKKAQYIGLLWQSITLIAAIFVGMIGLSFFAGGIANSELMFVVMTKQLFPAFIAGLILCAILASAINVIGAQVLVSASVIAEDFYKRFLVNRTKDIREGVGGNGPRDSNITVVSRISVAVICVLALVFAYFNQQKSIYDLVYYAWAGLGCSFGPLVLLSLHSNMRNKQAALWGIVTGGLTAGLWPLLNSSVPAMIPGFAISLACIFVVGKITNK